MAKMTIVQDDNGQNIHIHGRIYREDQYLKRLNDGLTLKSYRGVHGAPYQFMSSVDTRVTENDPENSVFGRKYAEKIVARMPLLLVTPGNPKFMAQISDRKKRLSTIKNLLEAFSSATSDTEGLFAGSKSQLDALLKEYTGKYYSLDFSYPEYYNYVNPMCRSGAYFLGIEEETLDGIPLKNYGWHMNTNDDLGSISDNTIIGDRSNLKDGLNNDFMDLSNRIKDIQSLLYHIGSIPFYIETDNQITESFSNDTTESSLSSMINGLSDQARELQFLLGAGNANYIGADWDAIGAKTQEAIDGLTDRINSTMGSSRNIFTNLVSHLQTIVTGGRLIFPEIWSDSSFSRSYSISMKLATPDCDKLSWYLNIYVPLCHLLALVCPRQSGPHGYNAPFLVRAFYKGLFNVDLGIITDMTFTKGKEGAWTRDGLPTVVDVSFTIKDLYQMMSITNNKDIKFNMMSNTAEMDYIANACGININTPDIERYVRMYFTQNFDNRITDAVRLDMFGAIERKIGIWGNAIFNSFR